MPKNTIEKIVSNIKAYTLKDFNPSSTPNRSILYLNKTVRHDISESDIPIPELVRIMLSVFLEFPSFGPGEKLRWELPFQYKKIPCSFALEKFGFRLYILHNDYTIASEVSSEIIRKIKKSISSIEPLLDLFARQQIKADNITLANTYTSFKHRYKYFRENACRLSGKKYKPKVEKVKDIEQSLMQVLRPLVFGRWQSTELLYNMIAMLDAYFASIENLFVLILPLRKDGIDIVRFISRFWSEKYKTLFDIQSNSQAKLFYDKLSIIKETYRNFYAHGGFEKGGASLFFHIQGIGAIPVQLSRVREKPIFKFFPVQNADFIQICKTLDDFDSWLRSEESGCAKAIRFIESDLDINCNQSAIKEIRTAMKSEKEFMELLELCSHIREQHENMDY